MIEDRHNCRERDGDKDTDRSEELAADDDRDQRNKCRQTHRVTEEMRLDNITVDRLKDTCEDHECDRIHRILQHEDKCTDHTSDDRTEGRQDIRNTNDYGDEDDVRESRDQHEDRIADADADRLEDRVTDVTGEDRIASL